MNDNDWEEAFRHLLSSLREAGDVSDVADEIDRIASRMVLVSAEEVSSTGPLTKQDRNEMGEFAVRARTPKERFSLALQILEARLVEHPAVVKAAQGKLTAKARSPIRFALDSESEVEYGEEFAGGLTAGFPQQSDMREVRKLAEQLRDTAKKAKEESGGVSPRP